MASSEMRQFLGDTQSIEFNGKTYPLERFTIGEFPQIASWVETKKREPYTKGKVPVELASRVLGQIDSQMSVWQEACDSIQGQFFIVYLAILKAMKKAPGTEVRCSPELVQSKLKLSADELKGLVFWLCSIEHLLVNDAKRIVESAITRFEGAQKYADDPKFAKVMEHLRLAVAAFDEKPADESADPLDGESTGQ